MGEGINKVLEYYEEEYSSGDKWQLFEAVLLALKDNKRAPQWVINAFEAGVIQYRDFEVKTTDEAFNLSRKGMHMAQAKKENDLAMGVYIKIELLKQEGRAVDDSLFIDVGEIFNISGAVAKNYYYRAREVLEK